MQNGVSLLYVMLEIHRSGRKPSICYRLLLLLFLPPPLVVVVVLLLLPPPPPPLLLLPLSPSPLLFLL